MKPLESAAIPESAGNNKSLENIKLSPEYISNLVYWSFFLSQGYVPLQHLYFEYLHTVHKNWRMSDEMLNDFLAIAKKKTITIDTDQLAKDKKYIVTRIKSEIARSIWGNQGWFTIMRAEDNQFLKAMTLFPEAEKIAGLR